MSNRLRFGVMGFFVLIAVAIPLVLGPFWVSLATEILVWALMAMSINLMGGYGGLFSLGQAGIFGISAYTVAYLTTHNNTDPYVAFVAGVLLTLAVSAVFGLLAVRASDIYFLMITLAEGMIVWGLAYRWGSVTGAENGIRGVVRPEAFASNTTNYYATLAVFAACAFLLWRIVRSPFGLTLVGIRESAERMRTLGYNVTMHKYVAFLLAGFFSGVGGGLYAFFNRYVSPPTVDMSKSSEGLLMVIFGGAGTFWGPLLGSAAIVLGRNIISLYTERWPIVLGLVFILTILFARNGVLGELQNYFDRRAETRRRAAKHAAKIGTSP